jgi:hypothetical protein
VSKNNLSKEKYCCLLEYDTEPSPDFHQLNMNRMINDPDAVAFFAEPISDDMFHKSTPWMNICLQKYNIDSEKINKAGFWYCTTNFVIKNKILKEFNDWFYEMSSLFKHDSLGSYMHERMINVYCILNEREVCYLKKN